MIGFQCFPYADSFAPHSQSGIIQTASSGELSWLQGWWNRDIFLLPVPACPSICRPFFSMMTEHTKQNQELTALRDWLLPMLMNGQVRVG